MDFLATTVKGLEDMAAKEIERFGGRVEGIMDGKVVFKGHPEMIYCLNYGAKRIFRVTLLLSMGEAAGLEEMKRLTREAEFCVSGSFAVRSKRTGQHGFTSMDVNAAVGEAILNKCPEAKVNLDNPDTTFLVWVKDSRFILTMDTTGESLHRRGYRVYQHPAPINPVLASLLLDFSKWDGGSLIDPFCGSGTILIEAYHLKNRVPNIFREFDFSKLPFFQKDSWNDCVYRLNSGIRDGNLPLLGVEKFRKHLKGAFMNAHKAGARIRCVQGEAERMHEYGDSDFVVTNPPFGLRIGSKKKIFSLYERFAEELEEHFSGSTFALIIPYEKFEAYFTVKEKREIMYGDLKTKIYRFKI